MTLAATYVLVLFVTTPDPYLAELADLAMGLAREADKRARAAASDSDFVQLTLAFERLARSVRLSRITDQRLQETSARTRRDDHARRLDHRSQQIRAALSPQIDAQPSLAQATRLRLQLSERLEHDRLFDVLSKGSVEQHIQRLSQRLGLNLTEDLYLPREAAGGGPSAEQSEEPRVEGASPTQSASPEPDCATSPALEPTEPP